MGGVSASFSYVYALAVSGSNLYAGGEFLSLTFATHIAKVLFSRAGAAQRVGAQAAPFQTLL
jgi:hypothetical protein